MKNSEIFEHILEWLIKNEIKITRINLETLPLNQIEVLDSLILISLILEIEILKNSKLDLNQLATVNEMTLIDLIDII